MVNIHDQNTDLRILQEHRDTLEVSLCVGICETSPQQLMKQAYSDIKFIGLLFCA